MRVIPLLLTFGLTGSALAAPAPRPTAAQEAAADKAFHAGTDLMKEKKYPAALAQFQQALAVFPDESAILWNAGTAALSSHQIKLATTYFERDVKSEPLNGQLYAHLMQCYQELGDIPHRDAMRTKLFAMHRSGKDDSGYTEKDRFCRDEFPLNGKEVFAYEKFALQPRSKDQLILAPRYLFVVFDPAQDKPVMTLEAGWDSVEADGQGSYRPTADDKNTFYFDAYYAEGEYSRKTFGLLPKEPAYEGVKQRLIDITNGKVKMTSGRLRSETGPGD